MNNDIDISSLTILEYSVFGNLTEIGDGLLEYSPNQNFFGQDRIIYQIFDDTGLSDVDTILIIVEADLFIPKGFSPNNDGFNDELIIPGIDETENSLYVFDQWGNTVYYKVNYSNNDPWKGVSITTDQKLQIGTYFYKLTIKGLKEIYTGYFQINY